MKNALFNLPFISVESLTQDTLLHLFEKTDQMKTLVEDRRSSNSLQGRIMGTLFYEPSSRTFASFVSAMQRLGGGFIPLNGMTNTSVAKGESLEDSAKVFSSYSDVLVIRNPNTGSAKILADNAWVPVINAGDGVGEHPTQALLDAYTISTELGTLENLHIVFVGEFAHYRPVNSLAKLLALFPSISMSFVSAPEFAIQQPVREYLKTKKIKFSEYDDLDKVIGDADVLYVTRPKKEFISEELYKKVHGKYVIGSTTIQSMKKHSVVMHPLPRLEELDVAVDADTRSVYLTKQMRNGLYSRMALLEMMLNP